MTIDWSSNKVQRICTGAALIACLAAAFALRLLTVWTFDVLIVFLSLVAVWEIHKAKTVPQPLDKNKKEKQQTRVISTALGALSVYYLYAYIATAYTMFIIGVATEFAVWLHVVMQFVVLFIFFAYTVVMAYADKTIVKECRLKKESLWGTALRSGWEFIKIIIYPFFMLSTMILINHIGDFTTVVPFIGADSVPVPELSTFGLLLVFMVTCLTDTFAYTVGMAMRGPALLPKKFQYISPKKTISGGIGGLFGGMTGALLTLMIVVREGTPLQVFLTDKIGESTAVQLAFIAIGLVGAIISTIGDLYASFIKRRVGIKDYGNYLPGHGGAMDRLDGISFNSVFICLVLVILVVI
ncbi:MAG: phosphatidate cytidylyltransferase [Christensenellaceae bacterium]|nr:phosphatidate cytidylyltransferase [Christensenellaceae bacterium]